MKTRIIKIYDTHKCEHLYVVQVWKDKEYRWQLYPGDTRSVLEPAYWGSVRDFPLSEYEKARQFAVNASKPEPLTEVVVFNDGVQQ